MRAVKSNRTSKSHCTSEFFSWTHEQARRIAQSQSAASNCGATALLNVFAALDIPTIDICTVERAVHTNSRKHSVAVSEYLEARSVAGCTGEDVVKGCEEVAGEHVEARFFAFYPPRQVDLQQWLAGWLRIGCSAVATLNTQRMYNADYWHHQMIYGVDSSGVSVTNGIEVLSFDDMLKGLESPSVMQVRKRDVLSCSSFDTEECDKLGQDWARLQVSQQIVDMRKGHSKIGHVTIPAAYTAGITVFARKGSPAASALQHAQELPLQDQHQSRRGQQLRLSKKELNVECTAAVAQELEVPDDLRTAFDEFHATLRLKHNREPPRREIACWRVTMQEARAEVTVREYMRVHQLEIEAAVCRLQKTALVDKTKLQRMVDQRLVFMGVYAKDQPLDEILSRMLHELEAWQLAACTGNSSTQSFVLRLGRFNEGHAAVRKAAYPYTPACCASYGDEVLDCLSTVDGELVGYMAMNGSYADDLSVSPHFQGRGVAKALVAGTAALLACDGQETMSLHVRACNLPAFQFYQAMGFEVQQRCFPSYYDWHGGYHMSASTSAVVTRMPAGFHMDTMLLKQKEQVRSRQPLKPLSNANSSIPVQPSSGYRKAKSTTVRGKAKVICNPKTAPLETLIRPPSPFKSLGCSIAGRQS